MSLGLRRLFSAALYSLPRSWAVPLIALLQFVLHLWVAAHDNFFRDELYYIAASRHLDFGFVDFPPLVALATAASRLVLGETLVALRIPPALAGVVVVLVTANMAKRMGAGLAAQVLVAFVAALAPLFIGTSGLMTMDPFDVMWWTLCAWTVLLLITEQEPRFWLLFGLFAGLGLLNKLTMGFYAGALVLGVLISYHRRILFNRWLIFGGLVAAALVSPYIIWNALRGFPTVEFTQMYAGGKTYQATPLEFLAAQIMHANPALLPLWLGGLYFLFFTKAGRRYQPFGWAYVFLFIFFMIQKAKFYWLTGAYPPIYAAGALGLDLLVRQRPRFAWLQPAATWVAVLSGLFLVPFAIPILSSEAFIRLNSAMGNIQVKQENIATSELPQNYADRFGWPEIVNSVKVVYDTLPAEDQARACIFTDNYGEAGAVDLFGPALGLPRALSGHNSYWVWGPQGCTGEVLITVGVNQTDLENSGLFETVEAVAETQCKYCLPHENGAPILVARHMTQPLEQVWPGVKDYK